MKGLIVLFLAVTVFGIAWGYASVDAKEGVKKVVRKNILPISVAVLAVAIAIFVSTNTTMRLV